MMAKCAHTHAREINGLDLSVCRDSTAGKPGMFRVSTIKLLDKSVGSWATHSPYLIIITSFVTSHIVAPPLFSARVRNKFPVLFFKYPTLPPE